MAQSNFEERIDTYEIESTNVMTGDRDQSRYLYYQLKMSMAKAKQIDIIVSFLMESGVRMLLNDMKRALDRGVKIRILTGNYLGITQPSALYLIKSELGDRVDLRLYNETSRSFHPKSYIFHYESSNEIYIGSSNISKSALWNIFLMIRLKENTIAQSSQPKRIRRVLIRHSLQRKPFRIMYLQMVRQSRVLREDLLKI